MSSRTGVLSDSATAERCADYRPIPMKYVNSVLFEAPKGLGLGRSKPAKSRIPARPNKFESLSNALSKMYLPKNVGAFQVEMGKVYTENMEEIRQHANQITQKLHFQEYKFPAVQQAASANLQTSRPNVSQLISQVQQQQATIQNMSEEQDLKSSLLTRTKKDRTALYKMLVRGKAPQLSVTNFERDATAEDQVDVLLNVMNDRKGELEKIKFPPGVKKMVEDTIKYFYSTGELSLPERTPQGDPQALSEKKQGKQRVGGTETASSSSHTTTSHQPHPPKSPKPQTPSPSSRNRPLSSTHSSNETEI